MTTYDFNDYVRVLVGAAIGVIAWLVLSGLVAWAWVRWQESRPAQPEPPAYTYPLTPEPTWPLCHHGDGRPAATEIAGWLLCAEHAAEIRNRQPYDQERAS